MSSFREIRSVTRDLLSGKELTPNSQEESRVRKFAYFCMLVGRGFLESRCPVRAAALAYFTLLAIVPMLAVAISVSSSLLKNEGHERIDALVQRGIAYIAPESVRRGDAETIKTRDQITDRINEFVQNTRSGTLGVTGMIALVTVGIFMLIRVENTFNDIWGVTRGRPWLARIVQYWATLSLGPVLLVGALALTSGKHFQTTEDFLRSMPVVGSIIFTLLPLLVLVVTFTLFYKLMPNTTVNWRAALVGGAVAGSLLQLNNMFSVIYVSQVVSNSRIYGSLGLVPVVMMGLYLSWIILLSGAQVAYTFQNRKAYLLQKEAEHVHQQGREFIALRIMTYVARKYHHGQPPPTAGEMAEKLGVPTRLICQVISPLIEKRLLLEVNLSEEETCYVTGRPLDKITYDDILICIRAGRGNALETLEDSDRPRVLHEFEYIQKAEREAASAVTLAAMANGEAPHAGGSTSLITA